MSDFLDPSGGHGGIVVAFRGRKDDAASIRLERALAGLMRATREQATAVATWRASLAELNAKMADLAASAEAYRATLAETAAGVDRLGAQTRLSDDYARN